ncbi:MAG: hypothetical protein HC880_06150 [Bacteroidia bacterium]|nr:hypothetical protein [Bacteroidia bacterium]
METITQMLGQDPDRFFQTMYRLDIPEDELKTALENSDLEMVAEWVIKREQLRRYFWSKYKNL